MTEPSQGQQPATVDPRKEIAEVGVEPILKELDAELVGLAPVKKRIREIAALLLVERVRKRLGLTASQTIDAAALMTIEPPDILASGVFAIDNNGTAAAS
jgi:hypothetical protein